MTGRAYRKSAEVARRMAPHAGYQENRAPMVGVIAKHRAAVGNINHADSVPDDLLDAARRSWDDALEIGEVHGFRNAQSTVLAPTGTISFMMDCDTTGVEPDFSLVKSKKLVGGGEITIVNKTVPMALGELGYAPREVEEIVAFIDERGGVVGAPHLKTEHYPVFDCAIGERAIHYMGHVKMMGAVQPFISGAISKTVNLPEQTTIDEIAQLFVESWQLGVKAIAIYRDNCKVAQPLSSSKEGPAVVLADGGDRRCRPSAASSAAGRPHRGRPQVQGRRVRGLHPCRPVRGRDARRHLRGHREGGHDPRRPHELVHDLGLARAPVRRAARGVRLEVQPHALRAERASRTTRTSGPRSRSSTTSSAGWARSSSRADQQEEAGILTPEVKARLAAAYTENPGAGTAAAAVESAPPGQTALFNQWEDAVECARCGGRMVRTGSCYTCRDCGTNTGCS